MTRVTKQDATTNVGRMDHQATGDNQSQAAGEDAFSRQANKGILADKVAQELNVPRRTAARVLDAVLDSMRDLLRARGKVAVKGFGTFERRIRKGRLQAPAHGREHRRRQQGDRHLQAQRPADRRDAEQRRAPASQAAGQPDRRHPVQGLIAAGATTRGCPNAGGRASSRTPSGTHSENVTAGTATGYRRPRRSPAMAMPQTNEADCQVTAACVQFDVRRGDVEANVAAVEQGLEDAAGRGARICVLPEMWSTSFLPRFPAPLLQAAAVAESKVLELSRRHGMMIVGSSPEASADGVHNSARVYDRGTALGVYRKIHLFSPNAEHKHHASGGVPLVIDSEVGRIGVMICYDLRFPELARYYFRKGVEILLVPAQWPEVRSQHWRTLLRARAIENEMFVIG
jgi:nucleoid DNA-binding protein